MCYACEGDVARTLDLDEFMVYSDREIPLNNPYCYCKMVAGKERETQIAMRGASRPGAQDSFLVRHHLSEC